MACRDRLSKRMPSMLRLRAVLQLLNPFSNSETT
jgi:hypothetical protein